MARLARRFYAGEIPIEEFLRETPEQNKDELIEELVELITHEPQKGGLFGVTEQAHAHYRQQVFAIIEKLERTPAKSSG